MKFVITAAERKPGVWVLRWYGQRYHREQYRTVHGTAADAERARLAWLDELETIGPPCNIRAITPLADVIREQHRFAERAPSTLEYFDRMLRLYIDPAKPTTRDEYLAARKAWNDDPRSPAPNGGFPVRHPIGRRPIGHLTYDLGSTFQQHLLDRFAGSGHGGNRTIAEVMRLCVSALDFAVQQRAIPANPWRGIPRVRARAASVNVPTGPHDLARVKEAAEANDRTGLLLRLALATGARRGELLALLWRHVDLGDARLHILGSLEFRDGAFTVRPTKSEAGKRTVPLPSAIAAELRTVRAARAERCLRAGIPIADVPVITGDDGFSYWAPNNASQAARRALHAAGLPASLHALRHWHGSTLLSDRVNPEMVRKQLGHGRITTTLHYYGHSMGGDEAAVTASIDKALRDGRD